MPRHKTSSGARIIPAGFADQPFGAGSIRTATKYSPADNQAALGALHSKHDIEGPTTMSSSNIEQIDRAAENVQDAAQAAADTAKGAVDRAADCAIRAVERIQKRPIQAMLAAMFTGVLIGFWVRR